MTCGLPQGELTQQLKFYVVDFAHYARERSIKKDSQGGQGKQHVDI